MEMKETTKAEDKPERKIFRREITSLDDDELWSGFDWEETDKILSGENKPKTLITSYVDDHPLYPHSYSHRRSLIAHEMLSVFPNSKYINMGTVSKLPKVIKLARNRRCTSLIVADIGRAGHDLLVIINLLNGASAIFRMHNLIERADIPNRVEPPPRRYPHLQARGFDSLASAGTARMIRSLFPKVSHSCRPSRTRSNVWWEKQKNYIFFRHHRFCSEEALAGQSSSAPTRTELKVKECGPQLKVKECGPRFALELVAVDRVSLDTGAARSICAAPWDALSPFQL